MGRPKKGEPLLRPVISMKGSEELRDWLLDVSLETGISQTNIVRRGLAAWAEKHGHPLPPEK